MCRFGTTQGGSSGHRWQNFGICVAKISGNVLNPPYKVKMLEKEFQNPSEKIIKKSPFFRTLKP